MKLKVTLNVRERLNMDGFILVNKQKGMTSFDVVFKLRKQLNIKKIGHTGTLDPDTTGLLVIAVGRATKFIPILSENSTKEYLAEAKFGIVTDTLDISGKVIDECEIPKIDEEILKNMLSSFVKTYDQFPPMYSAKKVNGKRLYDLARENKVIDVKPSTITIHDLELLGYTNDSYKFRSVVSKGSYIRSLIDDMAKSIGSLATMTELIRTKTDGFSLSDAKEIEDITTKDIQSLEAFVRSNYPTVELFGPICKMVKNGARLRIHDKVTYPCLYVDRETSQPIAIYDIHKDETKPLFMF